MLNADTNNKGSFLRALDRGMTAVTRTLNIVGMVILVAMTVLTVADVIMRTLFVHPILGSTEITEFMMVAMTLGMGWALLKEKVIRMGLVVDRLSPAKQAVITSITYTLGTLILGLITWSTGREIFATYEDKAISAILRIPKYPFYGLLAFSYLILTLSSITLVIQNIAKASKR